jgi:hypothetical protein
MSQEVVAAAAVAAAAVAHVHLARQCTGDVKPPITLQL